jgi:D-alanyl-D-alanine carboxypeptidase-like protein
LSTAEDRGWGRGWPVDRRRDMVTVNAGGITILVHKAIAPIVEQLLEETVAGGYRLKPGQCWGYANRAIRGSKRPSNHSWGLAVDLNAPANPMSVKLITDIPPWMVELWRRRGFRWGGDYEGRKDAMHFEFMGTPADAHRMVAELKAPIAPLVVSSPSSPVHDFEEVSVKQTLLQIGKLDDHGCGWADYDPGLGRDPMIVGVTLLGPSPPDDGYWTSQADVTVAAQPRGGKVRVVVRNGTPGDTIGVFVSVA